MSKFPLIEEIQDLKQKHRRSPERRKKINDLIEESLDYNGDKMRKQAKTGSADYDFRVPSSALSALRELQMSEPDLYQMLNAELRRRGYYTLLSIYKEDTGEAWCGILISW